VIGERHFQKLYLRVSSRISDVVLGIIVVPLVFFPEIANKAGTLNSGAENISDIDYGPRIIPNHDLQSSYYLSEVSTPNFEAAITTNTYSWFIIKYIVIQNLEDVHIRRLVVEMPWGYSTL